MTYDETFWNDKRALLARDICSINLNAGTLSPVPIPVLRAVSELRREQAANPSNFLWRRSGPLLERARARLAEYVTCPAGDLLLLPNTTFGINIIANSLQLPAGAEILTTDHEYGAMRYCWNRIAQLHNWTIRQIELPFRTEDPQEIVDAFAREIRPRTRALYFSHVTTTTGLVLPAGDLCKLAGNRGLLSIVDAAHAPGMTDVDLIELDPDFYTANCHKWMMCPSSAGFLYVKSQHKRNMQPLITSWGWEHDRAQPDELCEMGGTSWQFNLEFHGTTDRSPQMVIPEALDFRNELGGDESIGARVRVLSNYAREALSDAGFTCATPSNPLLSGAMIAFDFPCDDPIRARERLWSEFHVECPITVSGSRTFLRVSTPWFVTTDQIDRLAAVM